MPTYIAMLRGINVSGHNIIKMEALRASFASQGFRDIQTYVQSGNIVFKAEGEPIVKLAKKMEKKIEDDFGFSVPVFLRTAKEMEKIAKLNPFPGDPALDQTKLHITFLADAPPQTAPDLLQPLAVKPEQFRVVDREIYLYCPNGYGNTKLSNTAIEKKLTVSATTRNWNTVKTLLAMAQRGKVES